MDWHLTAFVVGSVQLVSVQSLDFRQLIPAWSFLVWGILGYVYESRDQWTLEIIYNKRLSNNAEETIWRIGGYD